VCRLQQAVTNVEVLGRLPVPRNSPTVGNYSPVSTSWGMGCSHIILGESPVVGTSLGAGYHRWPHTLGPLRDVMVRVPGLEDVIGIFFVAVRDLLPTDEEIREGEQR